MGYGGKGGGGKQHQQHQYKGGGDRWRYNGGSVDVGGSFGGGADAFEGAVITLDGTTFTGPFDTCAETGPETAPETIPEGSEPTSEATKTAAVMAVAAVVVGSSLIL